MRLSWAYIMKPYRTKRQADFWVLEASLVHRLHEETLSWKKKTNKKAPNKTNKAEDIGRW